MPYRIAFAFLCLASLALSMAPERALAQERARDHTFAFGRFFSQSGFGDVGISYDDIISFRDASELTVLPAGKRLKLRTKVHPCWGFINHQWSSAGTSPMYVGIQMVSLYQSHLDPDAVFVQRNDKWVSRKDGTTQLAELGITKLVDVSLSQFAHSHESAELLSGLAAAGGPLSEKWHAQVPKDDSADAASLEFWRKHPVDLMPPEYRKLIERGSKIRAENRLLKFVPTDSTDPRTAPAFNFDCSDSLLQAMVLRVHLPGTAAFEKIYYIDF